MTEPRAYRLLYSRGTAATLVLLSGSVLAISQTHVIRDWLAVLHPAWPRPWLWVNAAGFELVVLAVGLVLAATGQRSLWVAEVFLIIVSCGAAWDSAPAGTPLVRAILGSLMPLQYLAAVLAGHRLASVATAAPAPLAAEVAAAILAAPIPPRPRPAMVATADRPPSARTLRRWAKMAKDSGMATRSAAPDAL